MEPQTSSFDRISPTALMVAYVRQFTNIPYSKELSELVNAKAVVEPLLEQQSSRPVEIAVLIEGRYKAINQVMAKFNATQIIELYIIYSRKTQRRNNSTIMRQRPCVHSTTSWRLRVFRAFSVIIVVHP